MAQADPVAVAADRMYRSYLAQLLQHQRCADITSMQDCGYPGILKDG